MAIRFILRYPDPALRKEASPVPAINDEIRTLVSDMLDSMYASNGAGLAASQVGVPLRIFVIDAHVAGLGEQAPALVFINPELLELSRETQTGDEGCLSFPGIFVPVKRAQKTRIRATDIDGKVFELEAEGFFARALQHENDHLNGRLLIDNVGPVKREIIKRKLRRAAESDEETAGDVPGSSG